MKARLKNIINHFGMFLFIITFFVIAISAQMLVQHTADTYVQNTHPTELKYVGYVFVRGSDRIKSGTSWYYPMFSRITYQVPGKANQVRTIHSNGQNDSVVRKSSITVYDSLNPFAGKTKALARIQLSLIDGPVIDSNESDISE